MKKKVRIKIFIIIMLVVIICLLILSNLNKKNTNIQQQKNNKQQLGEITENNTYVGFQEHLSEVEEKEQKLLLFKTEIAKAITEKGVATSNEADATTMANNIKRLSESKSSKPLVIPTLSTAGNGSAGGVYNLSFDITDCGYSSISIDSIAFEKYVYAKSVVVKVSVSTASGTTYLLDHNGSTNTISNFSATIPVDATLLTFESYSNATSDSDRSIVWTNIVVE